MKAYNIFVNGVFVGSKSMTPAEVRKANNSGFVVVVK